MNRLEKRELKLKLKAEKRKQEREQLQYGLILMFRVLGLFTLVGCAMMWATSNLFSPGIAILGFVMLLFDAGAFALPNPTEKSSKQIRRRARTEHDLIPRSDLREISYIPVDERRLPWYQQKFLRD